MGDLIGWARGDIAVMEGSGDGTLGGGRAWVGSTIDQTRAPDAMVRGTIVLGTIEKASAEK